MSISNKPQMQFPMPNGNVDLKSVYTPNIFTATINGVSTQYVVGTTVNINAGQPPIHQYFGIWRSNTTTDVALIMDASSASTSFIMPDRDVRFTATFYDEQQYYVTMNYNGPNAPSGDGYYYAGDTVTIDATDVLFFTNWNTEGDISLTLHSASIRNSFEMPDHNVTISPNQQEFAEVFVGDYGNISHVAAGNGYHVVGSTVTIRCGNSPGQLFEYWNCSDRVSFDKYNTTTTFTMPSADVSFWVTWNYMN